MGVEPVRGFGNHVCTEKCKFWTKPGHPDSSVCLISHAVHRCSWRCLIHDRETTICRLTGLVIDSTKLELHSTIDPDGNHVMHSTVVKSHLKPDNLSFANIVSILHKFMDKAECKRMNMRVQKDVVLAIQTKLRSYKNASAVFVEQHALCYFMLLVCGVVSKATGSVVVVQDTRICDTLDICKLDAVFVHSKLRSKITSSLFKMQGDVVVPRFRVPFSSNNACS